MSKANKMFGELGFSEYIEKEENFITYTYTYKLTSQIHYIVNVYKTDNKVYFSASERQFGKLGMETFPLEIDIKLHKAIIKKINELKKEK